MNLGEKEIFSTCAVNIRAYCIEENFLVETFYRRYSYTRNVLPDSGNQKAIPKKGRRDRTQ